MAMARRSGLAKGFELPTRPPRASLPEEAATAFTAPKPSLRREHPGERQTVYFPPELLEELRVLCVRSRPRRSVSDAVTEAVRLWLQQQQGNRAL
jgi:hypothetical protein